MFQNSYFEDGRQASYSFPIEYHGRKRGSYSLPVEYHYVTKKHPRYVMQFHWHSECELIHILEGSITLTAGSKKYSLKKGDVLYVQNNAVHGMATNDIPDDCIYECIVFDFLAILQKSFFFDNYSDFFTHKKEIKQYYNENQKEIIDVVENLFSTVKTRSNGWKINTVGYLFQFLGLVIDNNYFIEITRNNSTPLSLYVERFENVFKLVRTKYDQVISLEEMADASGMSLKYFCKVFKQLTHYTPIEYLLHYRIEYSKYLLCVKKLSVSEAAIKTGFNSTAYFIKTFKKFEGIPPRKYVKRNETSPEFFHD